MHFFLQVNSTSLFISAVLSNLFYKYYQHTDNFSIRILSTLFLTWFYLLSLSFIINKNSVLKTNLKNSTQQIILFYLIILFILVLPSLSTNLGDYYTLIFNPLAFSAYFISFIALTVDEKSMDNLFTISQKFNTLLPALAIIDLLVISKSPFLTLGITFIVIEMLFYESLSKQRKVYILALLFINLLVQITRDNRGNAIFLLVTFGLFLLFYITTAFNAKEIKVGILSIVVFVTFYLLFYFNTAYVYIVDLVNPNSISTIDTRSFLYIEFFEDFKNQDWLIGRGYLGTYFSPYFLNLEEQGIEGGDYFHRFTIEVGFLNFLLKGGLLLLLPFIMIILSSIKRGFVDNNFRTISFRCSIFLLVSFLLMSFTNGAAFNIEHGTLWLLIGIINFEKNKQVDRLKEINLEKKLVN